MSEKKDLQHSLLFITLLLGMSALASFASDMYVAAFPAMSQYFAISSEWGKATISLFFIGLGFSQLIYGPLSDYIGRKKVMVFGFIVFFIGCLLCFFSKIFFFFLLGRLIQDIGAGATTCISRAMMRDTFSGAQLAKALSYVGMWLAIVPAIAPITGGYIQYYLSWKMEFMFMLAYAFLLFIFILSVLPETNNYIFQQKKKVFHVLTDYKKALCDPTFFINVLSASFILAMIYIFYSVTSFYLQNHLHWTEREFSRISLVLAAAMFSGRKINVTLSNYLSNYQIILLGNGLALLASLLMFGFYVAKLNIMVVLLLPMGIYAAAGGMIFSNTFVGATANYSFMIGLASSLYGFTQMSTIFLLVSLSSLLGIATIFGLSMMMAVLALIAIGLILYLINDNEAQDVQEVNA